VKFDSDKAVGISAIVVGVCSLFIVIYQTMLTRETAHASVLPYLMIAVQSNNERAFLLVNNTGIGPAMIEEVRVREPNGDVFTGDPYDYVISHPLPPEIAAPDVDRIVPGRLIPAGSTVDAVGVYGDNRGKMLLELMREFELVDVPGSWYRDTQLDPDTERAVLEIDYKSVYGDRWRVRSDSNVPQPL
jgi:hypothetical protein